MLIFKFICIAFLAFISIFYSNFKIYILVEYFSLVVVVASAGILYVLLRFFSCKKFLLEHVFLISGLVGMIFNILYMIFIKGLSFSQMWVFMILPILYGLILSVLAQLIVKKV